MIRLISLVIMTVFLSRCNVEKPDQALLRNCLSSNDLREGEDVKNAFFPNSDSLGILVPMSWLELSFEDDQAETVYLADSTLYKQEGITLSIGLSSSKKTVTANRISAHHLGSPAKFIHKGETSCYGEKCLWKTTKDSTMSYVSFSFIYKSRLRVINLSTNRGEHESERFCLLMSVISGNGSISQP
jgi:hypothetical protein